MSPNSRAPYYLRPTPKLLRLPQVMELTGLSKPTIYRMVEAGSFPKQRQLSPRTVGWLEQELIEWVESRPCKGQHPETTKERQTATQRPHGHSSEEAQLTKAA